MPITIEDIKAHKEHFGLTDLDIMGIEEYRRNLREGVFFWVDHHDFLRSTFSEEIFASNREQFDALIEHLQELRSNISVLLNN